VRRTQGRRRQKECLERSCYEKEESHDASTLK